MRGRLAVVSDIHGNAAALEAVLAEIDAESCDGVLCLGDTVGYGASPAKCLSSLIALGPQLSSTSAATTRRRSSTRRVSTR